MLLKNEVILQIHSTVFAAKERAIRSVDTERVLMYWQIGKLIYEEEQLAKESVDFGNYLIQSISKVFQPQLGTGFSVGQLKLYKQFYRAFPNATSLRTQLSWAHYRTLTGLESKSKRAFYFTQTISNNWSARQLEHQVSSQHYEKLLMSNHIKDDLAIARKDKMGADATEIINEPLILEFLDLKSKGNKSLSFEVIRRTYARAFMPWSNDEDERLELLYKEGKTIGEIAKLFQRNYGAISSRLRKKGLMDYRY